jgi:hypothetical protein
LFLRLKNYRKLELLKKETDGELYPRARDLYEALALPVGGDRMICERLFRLLRVQQDINRGPLTTRQSAVLRLLFGFIHCCDKTDWIIGDLRKFANKLLQREGEPFRMSPRETGSVLTSLGFTGRKRTNHGWELSIDQKTVRQIHELVAAYEINRDLGLPEQYRHQCEICRGKGIPLKNESREIRTT